MVDGGRWEMVPLSIEDSVWGPVGAHIHMNDIDGATGSCSRPWNNLGSPFKHVTPVSTFLRDKLTRHIRSHLTPMDSYFF